MTKYKERKDGEGFTVPCGEIYKLACCDCGLVHDVVFVHEDGVLAMAAQRNNRATGQRRRVGSAVHEVLHGKGRSKAEKTKAGSALSQPIKRFRSPS